MAKENSRCSGVVVRLNDDKGYGFIEPTDGIDELFFHYTDVKSENLRWGQAVEYTLKFDIEKKKNKAVEEKNKKNKAVDEKNKKKNKEVDEKKKAKAVDVIGLDTECEGIILWFDDKKKFGFIRPYDDYDDLFVHGSEINSDNFRNGQEVKFTVVYDGHKNRYKAVDVIIYNTRYGGVVDRFNDRKGFGFIKLDNGGDEELFVHRSEIIVSKDGGYHTLIKDQVVEFAVIFDSKSERYKAVDVTGINGTPIANSQPKPEEVSGKSCYNCGGSGHIARNCPNGGGGKKGGSGGSK